MRRLRQEELADLCSKVHKSASRHPWSWGDAAGKGRYSRPQERGPTSALFGSPKGFTNMDKTGLDTFDSATHSQASRQGSRWPRGVAGSQQGRRQETRLCGRDRARYTIPMVRMSGGVFQGEGMQAKAEGSHLQAPSWVLQGKRRHPASTTSSSPNLDISQRPLSSFCKRRQGSTGDQAEAVWEPPLLTDCQPSRGSDHSSLAWPQTALWCTIEQEQGAWSILRELEEDTATPGSPSTLRHRNRPPPVPHSPGRGPPALWWALHALGRCRSFKALGPSPQGWQLT